MTEREKTKRGIFKKYPDAIIYYNCESCGEILFYANKDRAENETWDSLRKGFMKNGKFYNVSI